MLEGLWDKKGQAASSPVSVPITLLQNRDVVLEDVCCKHQCKIIQ